MTPRAGYPPRAASSEQLSALLRGKVVVALTGAGISTESGIPGYRSPEALATPRRPIQGPDFVRSELSLRKLTVVARYGPQNLRFALPPPVERQVNDAFAHF